MRCQAEYNVMRCHNSGQITGQGQIGTLDPVQYAGVQHVCEIVANVPDLAQKVARQTQLATQWRLYN